MEVHTDSEEPNDIRAASNAICDILERKSFRHIEGFRDQDDVDEVNHLLNLMYDYCDNRRIWVQ